MSILITGGTGSLGACLAKKMIEEGYKNIVLFDYRPDYGRVSDIADKVEIVRGNVADWPDVVGAIRDFAVTDCIHLAALLFTESMEKPYAGFKINLEGTVNILEAARLFSVKKVLFASTIATYSPGLPEPVKEGASQVPGSLYGITKLAGEVWGLYYHQHYGIDFRALRFARIVNAGREGYGTALFPSSMIEDAIHGRTHEVTVPPDYRVPLTYIKDGAGALLLLYKAEGVDTRIYNINGILPSAGDILERVKAFLPGAPLSFAKDPAAPALVIPLTYDDSKASGELGWKMKYDLDAMIRDFIEEVQEGESKKRAGGA